MLRKNNESLIVIHNPNSTEAAHFDELQFELNKNGVSYSEYETESADTEENIAAMQAILPEHKVTVLSAAGDGTAMQLFNAILRSGKQRLVTTGLIDYGGFGDLPQTHNGNHGSVMDVLDAPVVERRALTINVNGEYWRDAPAYATLGFTALAAMEFDTPKSRQIMQRGPRILKKAKQIKQLGVSYFQHRNTYLPPFRIDTDPIAHHQVTDIIIANNPYVGGIIRLPDNHYDAPHFGIRAEIDVSHILQNIPFGLKALTGSAPFDRAETMRVAFDHASRIPIQTEGETAYLDGVEDIFIYKNPSRVLQILHPMSAPRR